MLHRLAIHAEKVAERLWRGVRAGMPAILPYRGMGREGEVLVRGRVVIPRAITRAKEAESVWRSVLNAYRRFDSAEVPRAKVRGAMGASVIETLADDEGFFLLRLEPQSVDPEKLWHEVGLQLADDPQSATLAHALIPSPAAEFGVISDIDDTIVRTGATSLRTMIRSVMLENAATRTAFEGVAQLYAALHRGVNPIFYVSSSPWNLYDLLTDFMELNGIPHGPMFLQDWGIDENTLILESHSTHKQREIQLLLDYYSDLRFVLIGDSGQHDPEIYLEVIRSNPGRIIAAIIRDVTEHVRDDAVARIATEVATAGSEMVYVAHSEAALAFTRERGMT